MIIVVFRMDSCIFASISDFGGTLQETTEGRQDKKPHIAAWTVGCFVYSFWIFLHIAQLCRDVYALPLSRNFSEYRTSREILT